MWTALTSRLRACVSLPFFQRASPLSAWDAVGWWESRRIPFNLIVGAAGAVTCVLCLIALAVIADFSAAPIELPDPPILPILAVGAFAVMANVCFTGGWIVELLVRWLWRDDGTKFASITFTLGLAFSVGVTLAPAGVMAGWTVVRFIVASSGH